MKKWDELPADMRVPEVKEYYYILKRHKKELFAKRMFDVITAGILLAMLSPVFLVLSILIKLDSKGPVIFRQIRITTYGRKFNIYKFRTMVNHADRLGTQVTTKDDARVTEIGKVLRKYRLDELPQLFNILKGEMSFVGTRPEVEKYVLHYTNEMKATLLLPAGVTSRTSIKYKDEERLLQQAEDADEVYINRVLPAKMKYNLEALKNFGFWEDMKTLLATLFAVVG